MAVGTSAEESSSCNGSTGKKHSSDSSETRSLKLAHDDDDDDEDGNCHQHLVCFSL
jgi:hypothetical protein